MHSYIPFIVDESYVLRAERGPLIVDDDVITRDTTVNGNVCERIRVDVKLPVNVCD